MTRPTKAIVIAAGRGRRLVPYTDEMPKCMVPVDHRSIAQVQLEALRAHGITDVVFIRGYLGEVLEARAGELGDVRFIDNNDWENNNILESLFCAAAELDGPVLTTYSDIIFTPEVVGALIDAPGDVALVIDRDFRDIYEGRTEHPLEQAEVCDLDESGGVARVGKRALPPEQAWGEFIGLAKLSATGAAAFTSAWSELCERYRGRADQPFERAPTFRQAYLTDLLQHLINGGLRVEPVGIHGSWREIDTVQDLQRARALLSSTAKTWR